MRISSLHLSLRRRSQRAILRAGSPNIPPAAITHPAIKNGPTNDPVASRIAPNHKVTSVIKFQFHTVYYCTRPFLLGRITSYTRPAVCPCHVHR